LFRQWYAKLSAERDQAKASGDENRVKQIECRGAAQQERFHQQAFSTASVADLVDKISQEIPEVMHHDPSVEYVDVTLALVKKFAADPKILRMVEDLMKQPPVPAQQHAGH
jgi:hypothetical protein